MQSVRDLASGLLLAGVVIGTLGNTPTARAVEPLPKADAPATGAQPATSRRRASGYPIGRMPESARANYERVWGVDRFSVKVTESGALVRVRYRVTDAEKAAPLHDRASKPYLLDERTLAVLQVPVMDKVGPLRQSTAPEAGKSYWMVFSNSGRHAQPGDRVSLIIGQFRMDGLLVE